MLGVLGLGSPGRGFWRTTKMMMWTWRWPLTNSKTSLIMNPRRGELQVVNAKARQLTLREIE